MKILINGIERYFDGILVKNCEIWKRAVDKKWDGLFYCGGYEGDGKSEFAAQLALYFDHTYCLERCVFTPQQFIDAVEAAEPGQAIVYDEAQDVMESTAKDKSAREIKSLLTRIRKKQLFIIIVAPDFWRINKYLFIHRSRAFFRIYANGLERGFFELYNREKKHELKIRGQRNEQLVVPPNLRGRFTHWFPLDQEAYERKKDKATSEIGKEVSRDEKELLKWKNAYLTLDGVTIKEKAAHIGMSDRNLYRLLANLRDLGEIDGVTNTKQLTDGGDD